MSRTAGTPSWALAASLAGMLLGGCGLSGGPGGSTGGGERRSKLEQERAAVEGQWAETLAALRPYEEQELDRRLELLVQRMATLEEELGQARGRLASVQARRKELLDQMESSASSQPDGRADWAGELSGVRLMISQGEIDCVTREQRLLRAREGEAALRRLIAQRDMLVRQAAEQERRLRELDRKLGK